jgi:hypothetical protein
MRVDALLVDVAFPDPVDGYLVAATPAPDDVAAPVIRTSAIHQSTL